MSSGTSTCSCNTAVPWTAGSTTSCSRPRVPTPHQRPLTLHHPLPIPHQTAPHRRVPMVGHHQVALMDSIHSSPKTIMLYLPLRQLTMAGVLCGYSYDPLDCLFLCAVLPCADVSGRCWWLMRCASSCCTTETSTNAVAGLHLCPSSLLMMPRRSGGT